MENNLRITDSYGENVFNDHEMRKKLPKDIYENLKKAILEGSSLDISIANSVANAMKEWAVEHGATHYTHWFQPLNGATAEKHDSFISPQRDGNVIMEFSGSELIKGEPDASSFPSGGLRATFEARGYTAWDPTSFAFVKEKTLCIPTAFCSYSGAVLDQKTPLLKSMEVLNTQALRIIRLFGMHDVKRVTPQIGLEQEYFLVDRSLFLKRRDFRFCGHALLGAKPPKGQELDDHYFGAIRPRITAFMEELDRKLWKFGIPAKTEHNETAPAQHELASLYANTNLAIDQNLLIMEEMKKTAEKYDMECLLHEKPFDGINGSGKHNNWSLATDTGINLLEKGDTYVEHSRYLLFIVAMIVAMDRYNELLAATIASPSNDHRLGGDEAPPFIVSLYLGDEMSNMLENLSVGSDNRKRLRQQMSLSATVLPNIPKDASDRNRTSPIAFTGDKFEFRMLGSMLNASEPNVVINAAMAEVLGEFADILENADNLDLALSRLIREQYQKHKRIVFNGNGYDDAWFNEAQKRNLKVFNSTYSAAQAMRDDRNIALYEKFGILSRTELESRYQIKVSRYSKTLNIEALTMLEMLNTEVIPAAVEYSGILANSINEKKKASMSMSCIAETRLLEKSDRLINEIITKVASLEDALETARSIKDETAQARFYSTQIKTLLSELRKPSDALESITGKKYWPYPTNEELLFSV